MTELLVAVAILFVGLLLALWLVHAMRQRDSSRAPTRLGGGTVGPQTERFVSGRIRIETTPALYVGQTSWLFPRRKA